MKTVFALIIAVLSFSGLAHEIEGTLMLKGSLKTEVRVNNIKTTCKVKIKDIKNLMEEDSFGNPAYKVEVGISLNGGEFMSNRRVKFEKILSMNNLFKDGVRDLEYHGEGYKLTITDEGRLSSVIIPYGSTTVICHF